MVAGVGQITEQSWVKKVCRKEAEKKPDQNSLQKRSPDQFIDSVYIADLQKERQHCAAGTEVGTKG